jgi:hypothetical protein
VTETDIGSALQDKEGPSSEDKQVKDSSYQARQVPGKKRAGRPKVNKAEVCFFSCLLPRMCICQFGMYHSKIQKEQSTAQ